MFDEMAGDGDLPFDDSSDWGDWDDIDELGDDRPPSWRRPVLVSVAALTAIALALVPIYNLFLNRSVADNGLEICGFDYCIVQEAVTASGADLIMSRLANTFLDEVEARALADELTEHLGIRPVRLTVVEDLEGRLGGVYDPDSRTIVIERPARAWTIVHEVAHAVETGHGEDFQTLVVQLAQELENRR